MSTGRFKPGQEVVCVRANGVWYAEGTGKIYSGPKEGDIVTVNGYEYPGFLLLCEYPNGAYIEEEFEPVVSKEVIEELFKEEEALV